MCVAASGRIKVVAVLVAVVGRGDWAGSLQRKGGGRMKRICCVVDGVCSVGGRDRAFVVLWEDDVVGACAYLGFLLQEPIPIDHLGLDQEKSHLDH